MNATVGDRYGFPNPTLVSGLVEINQIIICGYTSVYEFASFGRRCYKDMPFSVINLDTHTDNGELRKGCICNISMDCTFFVQCV